MERISFTMLADNNEKITVRSTLEHIKQTIPQIKVPDTDINTIPLADLTLTKDNTKKCVDGYAEGTTWINGRCTQYKFTLVFA